MDTVDAVRRSQALKIRDIVSRGAAGAVLTSELRRGKNWRADERPSHWLGLIRNLTSFPIKYRGVDC